MKTGSDEATYPSSAIARYRGQMTVPTKIVMTLFLCLICARADAREWTCSATIFATGTNQQYTPSPWRMETGGKYVPGFPGDRERACRNYIDNVFLNVSLWKHLTLTPEEQDRICKRGRGVLRIEYGFDRRPKSWEFTKTIAAPPCDCETRCKSGYHLNNSSSSGSRCVKKLCETSGIPDQRWGPHENGIGVWHDGIYHHQPVETGSCKFK